MSDLATGGCLCGAVRFAVRGTLRDVVACHCSQCRRSSGNYVAATRAARADLVMTAADGLQWYRSSDAAERGFCNRCGSNLFWRGTAPDSDSIAIMAGSIDPPTRLKLMAHIFVGDKSDYYEISDGVPQHAALD